MAVERRSGMLRAVGLPRTLGLLVVALIGCASDELASRAAPILAGARDESSTAVVAIVQNVGACGAPILDCGCSGVLVAPRVVLTAGHCLENAPASALEIFFGSSIEAAGERIGVVEGHLHPAYDRATHAYDVAALVLAKAAPAAPVRLRVSPVTVDLEVRVSGFGIDDPKAGRTGVRRSGTAQITDVAEVEFRIAAKPAMTCHGDSGGPVFVGEELAGITTWGDPPCASFGVAARVDRLDAFLSPILAQAAAPLVQPPFDADASLCGTTCARASDCPAGTACTVGDDGRSSCTFRGLAGYRLGKACSAASDCSEACLDTPAGCRCLSRCESTPAPAPEAKPSEGSCAMGPPGRFGPLSALVLLACVRLRRRR